MFNDLCSQIKMHMCHIYLSYFSVLYQLVVGILGKFPNWYLFQSKFWLSVGKLWATIEISISAPAVNQNLFFSNIICVGYLQNFTFGPVLCSNLCLVCGQMGNFYYFSHCLARWLSKPWHFAKFQYFPHQNLPFLKCVKVVS